MVTELTGGLREAFESRPTPHGFELWGEGRLRRLSIDFGEGWGHARPGLDVAGVDLEHELGVAAKVRVRSGQRVRIEVTLESVTHDVVTVPGPVMRAVGSRPAVSWLARASGEIVLPSPEGPGLLTQRRGLCTPRAELGEAYVLEESVLLAPRQTVATAWTYEALSGDELEVPAEQTWLPWARHVPVGEGVEFSAPDGMVTAGDLPLTESEGEFVVMPRAGLQTVDVWGPAGCTKVEVGAFRDLAVLRGELMSIGAHTDVWAYVAVRHMTDSWASDDLLDAVDRVIGDYSDRPTAWIACAAALAEPLGLPVGADAAAAAEQALAMASRRDGILLALHGLTPGGVAAGSWPIGDFERLGRDAFEAIGYGRISTDARRIRGVDVALAKLYAAGLGETERGIRLAAYAQAAENRLLSELSASPNTLDVAWLSV